MFPFLLRPNRWDGQSMGYSFHSTPLNDYNDPTLSNCTGSCTHTYTLTHLYTHMCTHTLTHILMHTHIHTHSCTWLLIHTCSHICIHTYIYSYEHTPTHSPIIYKLSTSHMKCSLCPLLILLPHPFCTPFSNLP